MINIYLNIAAMIYVIICIVLCFTEDHCKTCFTEAFGTGIIIALGIIFCLVSALLAFLIFMYFYDEHSHHKISEVKIVLFAVWNVIKIILMICYDVICVKYLFKKSYLIYYYLPSKYQQIPIQVN